ncbi:hypothetical protein ACFQ4K_18255 [Tistrella bauzanensis]
MMITTAIARVHAGDQAGAGRNWLLAWLVVGTVVITGISAWLSADLVDITSLRQAYGFTLVVVLGHAAIIGQLPAMRAHPRHRRPGRALAIVLTLNLFSVTMTLLGAHSSLRSPAPGSTSIATRSRSHWRCIRPSPYLCSACPLFPRRSRR